MQSLRKYQQKAVDDIIDFFLKGKKSLIVQAPTGAGKTVIFSHIAEGIAKKRNKVLILTNRTELLTQAGSSIKRMGVSSFYIQAGCNVVSDHYNVYIAMSSTLRNRVEKTYWKKFLDSISLVIIDEAHLQDFNYIFPYIKEKYILGFTATPKRSGKMRQLGLDYEEIVHTTTVRELIDLGYLVNDDYYGFDSPDLNGVEIDRKNGDYKESQLFSKFNTTTLYEGVVKNYQDICPGTKALVFCVNIEHCIRTCLEFKKEGINAKFIVSGVSRPKEKENPTEGEKVVYAEKLKAYELYEEHKNTLSGEREVIFEGFAKGEFNVLINAGIATTGYDCPSIETIILNRATTSLTLLLQMIGRGSRICEGKTHFNILDFGGNCARLGYYTEERYWILWHDESNGKGLPPVKHCGFDSDGLPLSAEKGCNRMILAAYKICPFCGYKYEKKELKTIELSNILFSTEQKKAIKTKRIKDMTLEEVHEYFHLKKHKPAWLWRQLYYKGGVECIREYGKKYFWKESTISSAINFVKG